MKKKKLKEELERLEQKIFDLEAEKEYRKNQEELIGVIKDMKISSFQVSVESDTKEIFYEGQMGIDIIRSRKNIRIDIQAY